MSEWNLTRTTENHHATENIKAWAQFPSILPFISIAFPQASSSSRWYGRGSVITNRAQQYVRTNQSNNIKTPDLSLNTVWAQLISGLSFLDGKYLWYPFITVLLTAWQPFWGSESLFPFAVSQSFDGIIPVSCVQAWYYFTHQNDRWHLKALVNINVEISFSLEVMVLHRLRLWCLLTPYIKGSSLIPVESSRLSRRMFSWRFPAVYTYTITNWGNVAFLGELVRYVMMLLFPLLTYRPLNTEHCWLRSYLTCVSQLVALVGELTRNLLVGTHHVYGAMVSPLRPLVLNFLFDWLLWRYSFLATRIWRCQFPFTVNFSILNIIKSIVSDRKVWLIVIIVRAYFWVVDCG